MIVIRPTTAADGPMLRAIRLEALSDTPDAYGSTFSEAVTLPDEHWEQDAGTRPYFLAFDDGVCVGMASGGPFPPHPNARWLYGMYVTPSHRGTGVAERLVRAVAAWAREQGVHTLGLHVTISVSRAVAFYRRLGFEPIGELSAMGRDHRLMMQTMTTDLDHNDRI